MNACKYACSVLVLFFAITLSAQPLPRADFYVSPDGDDAATGNLENPFATLDKARQAVRELIAEGLTEDVLVYLMGGSYHLQDTVYFDAGDSGTNDFTVTYSAYPGQTVHLIGGVEISADLFTTVTDEGVRNRLPSSSRDQVLVADLAANGITDYGELIRRGFNFYNDPFSDRTPIAGMELFFGGHPMQLAKWPNESYEKVAGAPDGQQGFRFQYDGDRPERWTIAEDPWFYGHWNALWADCYFPVEEIDTETKTVTIRPISPEETERYGWSEGNANGNYGIEPERPFYALNLLEEIDRGGEWYLDRIEGKLYFYPPSPLDSGPILLSTLERLLVLEGASHITFQNIILEVGRDNLVEVEGGEGVVFHRCVFRNGGTAAVAMRGTGHGIDGCEVSGMGDTAIAIDGGDRYTLTNGENYLRNTNIHDYGRWTHMGTKAALVLGCGHDISHNLIHDAPHMASRFRGNNHTIEFNEIYNLCQDADDAGAVYTGRDWSTRGTLIRFNYFHDIASNLDAMAFGVFPPEGVHAVYFDDSASGNSVVSNIFRNIQTRDVMIGGGRDNLVLHNVMTNSGAANFIDRRLITITAEDPGYLESRINQIERYNYTQPPWSDAYPALAHMFDSETPMEPEGNMIWGNLASGNNFWVQQGFWGSTTLEVLLGKPRSFLDEQGNIEDADDPGFVNEAGGDLNLAPDSPAFTIEGFTPIPFAQIGLDPGKPVIFIEEELSTKQNACAFTVRGSAEPWANVATATLGGHVVTSALMVTQSGAIEGQITLDCFHDVNESQLEIQVKGPKGHLSPVGTSSVVHCPVLCPSYDDDDDNDDNNDSASDDDDDNDDDGDEMCGSN